MARERCDACFRIAKNCLCGSIVPIKNRVEVFFCQHPLEKFQIKNTARLTHLSLENSAWVEGEEITDLSRIVKWQAEGCFVCLLYPALKEEGEVVWLAQDIARQFKPEKIKLVVLDGTWKKTRKMIFLNPILAALPKCDMALAGVSAYQIRKQKNAESYSTLEAVQQSLAVLENAQVYVAGLSLVLDALQNQYLDYAGRKPKN